MKTDLTLNRELMVMAIVKSEGIRDGKPVIQGSRVAVGDIEEAFHSMDRSVEQIAEDFGIGTSQVEEALRYSRKQERAIEA